MSSDDSRLSILLINQSWFCPDLTALGHRVLAAGWAHPHFHIRFERLSTIDELLSKLPEDFKPDRIIYFDDSYAPSLRGLERLTIPSIFYSIDAHHHAPWHAMFGELFDAVLVAQKDYLPAFLSRPSLGGGRARWFPLWAPLPMEPAETRDLPVTFRGTLDPCLHPERAEFFRRLSELVPVDAAEGPYTEVYPRSKIVVNQAVGPDLNFRVFEAMFSGALLVTPRISNGLLELFEEGKHLVAYTQGDVEDAAQKIRHYLDDENARLRIAEAGRLEVVRRHSYAVRGAELAELLASLQMVPKSKRHSSVASSYLIGLGTFREAIECTSEETRAYRNTLVAAAKDSLLAAAEAGESVDEDFRAAVLLCKCFLEIVATQEAVTEFSGRICTAAPGDLLLTLSLLEDLLSIGRSDEARNLAAQFSLPADELFLSLPPLMQQAKKTVLDSVRKRL